MTPRRRSTLLLAGAGLAAAAAGVAWRFKSTDSPATAALPADAPENAFWNARFEQPDGQPLVMSSLRGAPLVLNFWATWCPPCVKEMPELDRFARDHAAQGVKVVGLAIDSPTPVRQFLQRTPVGYPIALAAFEGTDLSRTLGNDRGALPFTVVFDRRGAVAHRKLGETNFAELAGWVASLK